MNVLWLVMFESVSVESRSNVTPKVDGAVIDLIGRFACPFFSDFLFAKTSNSLFPPFPPWFYQCPSTISASGHLI